MKTADHRNFWLLLFSRFFSLNLIAVFCSDDGFSGLCARCLVKLVLLRNLVRLTVHDVGVARLIVILLLQNILLGQHGRRRHVTSSGTAVLIGLILVAV